MCVTPYISQGNDGKYYACKCGHCLQCLKDFQNEWSFRLGEECKRSIFPLFITLTYNDEHLPVRPDADGVLQSVVCKKDFQDFMKRFRRYNPQLSKGCRYFAIGEYGSKKNRAHMHAVLILPEIRWNDFKSQRLLLRYLYKRILKAWTLNGKELGFVYVEPCLSKQIKYVTKYMNKLDRRDHLVKPFRLMSKSIGLNFLSQAMVDYYLSTFDRTVKNGDVSINMPAYYRKKLDEMSHKNWLLKRAGMTYSELLKTPEYKDGSLRATVRRIQQDFCDNFDKYYRQCVAHISYMSWKNGYQVWEPNPNDVYQFVVNTNHELQDVIRISNDTLNAVCIRNSITKYDFVGVISPP